jgi:hypothetical protein
VSRYVDPFALVVACRECLEEVKFEGTPWEIAAASFDWVCIHITQELDREREREIDERATSIIRPWLQP